MEFKHRSVLLDECIENLNIKPDGVYVDGTLGGGGHAEHICQKLNSNGVLIGIDRDEDAIAAAGKRLKQYSCKQYFVQSNYSDIKNVLRKTGVDGIDGALLDLGVSSFQLDNAERGFSYMQDAPLDMRMNRKDSFTAFHVVNEYSEKELSEIIKKYGEERWAARIAKFIVNERKNGAIETTGQLVDIIKAAVPAGARRDGPHPAKRTFQAIRIEVNDELSVLGKSVEDFLDVLLPGGRLCIISFHSLEDRIVKNIMNTRADPCTCPPEFPVCVCGKVADIDRITRKPLVPGEKELAENPRARSAKLRVAEKRGR
ncbi:MAG: 16S rRNA (cytosine(1402)-N(4))-methyltransferase RsmH [Eubacteriaceae bacterium]|nr:16S rRNA (cytosine(1402)-N(4))-methyltransferase RsmH [Eubacteriaceae bacterium]